jgi:hypothetical protein
MSEGETQMTTIDAIEAQLPPYVTVYQLAKILRCCPQTVRSWCKRGVLPAPLALSRRKQLWDVHAILEALANLQRQASP